MGMTEAEIRAYCLSKREACEDQPFGPLPFCFRVRGRIFAQLYTGAEDYKITLKSEPMRTDFYRQLYPGAVGRAYYCPERQQPYWFTVSIDRIDREVLMEMIDHAYRAVLGRLPKRDRLELEGG